MDYSALLAEKDRQNEALMAQNAALRAELADLKRMIFGRKSERFEGEKVDANQLALELKLEEGIATEIEAAPVETIQYQRQQKKKSKTLPRGRQALPAHLEREEIRIEPKEDTASMRLVGEQIVEQLEYRPGNLYVISYILPIYSDQQRDRMVKGSLPNQPIEGGLAGPALLAHLLVSKYLDHLPFYRLQQIFKRERVDLARSTMSNWLAQVCQLIEVLADKLRASVQAANYLMGDETPVRVQDRSKKGKTHSGYLWAYYAPLERLAWYDYQKSRARAGPEAFLDTFEGYFQTDGYKVYDHFDSLPHISLVGCMAHARRYFEQALSNDQNRAQYALKQFQQLYAIERKAREEGLDHLQRYALRQQEALAILEAFHIWMKDQYEQVIPRSKIGKAIAYNLRLWKRLTAYLEDGKLEIDNNLVENQIRPVVLGRKNYLFFGSQEAAPRSAMIYSLLGTCKLHQINPQVWLTDILSRIQEHPVNQIEELLPQNWKKTQNQP